MKNKLLNKFLSFSYGSWVGLVIGVVYTMITTRLISPDDFGKASMYTLAINVVMILTIFGTDQSFIRFYYEEEKENRSKLLYACLKLPLITTLLVSILILLLNQRITLFLFNESNFFIAIIIVLGVIIQLFNRYAKLVIRMEQKGNLYSIIEILDKVLRLVFLISIFSLIGSSYEVIIYSTILTLLIVAVIAFLFGRSQWNIKNCTNKSLNHTQKDILKYGSPFVLTIFITWLFESFDKIAIRYWSTYEQLGIYSIAFQLVAMLTILRSTFSTFWTPVSYEAFIKKPDNKSFFENMTNIVSFVMFAVAIASIAGKDIIILLLGNQYSEAANIMPFLIFMPLLFTISETTVIGINFYKKTKWHIAIALISCFVNIIGNWLLVPKYGAIGASLSTAFAYIVFFTIRTLISINIYKVNYNLGKIYFMILIMILYGSISIVTNSILLNIISGLIPLIVLIILYYKDLVIFIRKPN